jgi:hypothetical protein
VNGQDGGGRTYGTIDASGFYSAPVSTPQPPKFPVCARAQATPTIQGCAVVVINPVPTQGADMVVFNDMNLFDNSYGMNGGTPVENRRLVQNLVVFSSTGSRNNGTEVLQSFANSSVCYLGGYCGTATFSIMDSVITANGFTEVFDTAGATLTSVPSNVKTLFLWQPTDTYTVAEINGMKSFAAEGGRIVFVGEYQGYYGLTGIGVQNKFLLDMGAQMTNLGNAVDCNGVVLPDSVIVKTSPIMAGIDSLTIACASVIQPGPNDFVLFYNAGPPANTDTVPGRTLALAGVAKIDLTPLPAPPAPIRLNASARGLTGHSARKPSVRLLVPRGDGAHR